MLKKGRFIKCNKCGKSFYRRPSKIDELNFCSKECSNTGKRGKPKLGKFVKCDFCKKEIWIYPRDFFRKKHFCSIDCVKNWEKTDRGYKSEIKCKQCGSIYKVHKSYLKIRSSSFCSNACLMEHNKNKFVKRKILNQSSNQKLKKQFWNYFSKFIRQRDKGICISCGKIDDWHNTDAGHYIPKTAGLSIYFDERNVNCQCVGCNRFRHGNLSAYAIALRKKYGETILEELDNQRKITMKITDEEYIKFIELYKKKINDNGYAFK